MMHSIAFHIKRQDSSVVRAMCVQFIPKPVIKIVRRTMGGMEISRTMSFTESVCWVKEQGLENVIDFDKAYGRAGASIRSTLSQHFVLLGSRSRRF